jgi:chemotaxis protein methyltransferase CheR
MALQGSLNERDFTLFSKYIAEKSGIIIPPEKSYIIETRLAKMMLDAGHTSYSSFYRHITSDKDPEITSKIISAVTVNETMWFRDSAMWKVLDERLLPDLVEKLVEGKRIKVRLWCTASSTGQEAYSVAMHIDDYLRRNRIRDISLSNFEILSTDISERVLETAKRGRYDRISMSRGLPDYFKNKYFINHGSVWDIDPRIRKSVQFKYLNLIEDFGKIGTFDIILCRYVLIYFSDELKQKIVNKMRDVLVDGGTLFTGIYVVCDLFKEGFYTKHYDNLTYYEKGNVTNKPTFPGDTNEGVKEL